jgi:hypothetical protein
MMVLLLVEGFAALVGRSSLRDSKARHCTIAELGLMMVEVKDCLMELPGSRFP